MTHKTVHDAEQLVEGHRFNVMVARMMELVNATRKAIDSGVGPADPAVREATEAVAMLLSLVAPYIAEEMWERLGHQPSRGPGRLAGRRRGAAGRGLGDVAVVQIQGKVKARLEVLARHLRRRPGGAGAGRPGRGQGDRRARGPQGDRARAEAGQRRRVRPRTNLRAMSIAVVTDSTASLPPEVAEERGIVVVPLQVVIGANAYDEGSEEATPAQGGRGAA